MAYRADRTLWLNADRSAVVEDGHPDAAFLLATKGKEIPADLAKQYGLGKDKAASKAQDEAPATKAVEDAPTTKALEHAPENKSVAAPPAKKGGK